MAIKRPPTLSIRSNLATVATPTDDLDFTYDPLNRLTRCHAGLQLSYNSVRRAIAPRRDGSNGRTLTWNYDGIYRLTNETISGDPSQNNRPASAMALNPGWRAERPITQSSSAMGQLRQLGYTPSEISSETYDAMAMYLPPAASYNYDSENHMTSATGNGKVVTMVYDAFGNRVAKNVNGVTTRYLVEDGRHPTACRRCWTN